MQVTDEMVKAFQDKYRAFWPGSWPDGETSRELLTAALAKQPCVATWSHTDDDVVGHLYYFALTDRAPGPYKNQRVVKAIIDIADDGTLAGVELIDDMPAPPKRETER